MDDPWTRGQHDQWAETIFDIAKGCYQVLKSKTSQRRSVEAGRKSSDDKVSLFVINFEGKVFTEVPNELPCSWISAFIAHPRNSRLPSCESTVLTVS